MGETIADTESGVVRVSFSEIVVSKLSASKDAPYARYVWDQRKVAEIY